MPNTFEERVYVNKANEFLGNIWTNIEDRETPDFEAVRDGSKIGIEVTNIYTSHGPKKGSPDKKRESDGDRKMRELAKDYYRSQKFPITVKVLGCDLSGDSYGQVLSCLLNHTPTGERKPARYPLGGGIKVYVTDRPDSQPGCLNHGHWGLPNNHVGWPRKVTTEEIQFRVNKKGRKLQAYNEAFASIDLLIVAVGTRKSGMLLPPDSTVITNPGFANIYFLSYPESITCLTESTRSAV